LEEILHNDTSDKENFVEVKKTFKYKVLQNSRYRLWIRSRRYFWCCRCKI